MMGSFGTMDWSHNKGEFVLWDWGTNAPAAAETPKVSPPPGLEAPPPPSPHAEPVHYSSCGTTFSSSSDMGRFSSSKSSSSLASTDSLRRVEEDTMMKLTFAAAPVTNVPDTNNNSTGNKAGAGPSPSPALSGEPVIGLKLGKRTYFEDGFGGQSAVTTTPTKKVKKGAHTATQQNPAYCCCQVEGCRVDLSSAKEYHRKHKVCEPHSKSPKVVVGGVERRFCQQCSRFHALSEFDQRKRSCRRRLSDHNARRRKPPHSDAISSFGGAPSRLSTAMFYADVRNHKSFLWSQAPPYDHQLVTCAGSSWDTNNHPNYGAVGGFRFAETKAPWLKPTMGFDGTSHQVWSSVVTDVGHRDGDDGFVGGPFKGTRAAKVLHHQGVEEEASAAAVSDMTGPPTDLHRARSLLSSGSADADASDQAIHLQQPGLAAAIAGFSGSSKPPLPVTVAQPSAAAGLWQDHQARFQQPFDPLLLGAVAAAPHRQFLKPTSSYDGSYGMIN